VTEPNTALEDAQAEADTDRADYVVLPLRDVTVRVLPERDWPSSAVQDLNGGDFHSWAEKCLADDTEYDDDDQLIAGSDDGQLWLDTDPTLGEVEDFFEAWEKATGQNRGKSRPAARSSRRTRRR
jgi:hypothetical protein